MIISFQVVRPLPAQYIQVSTFVLGLRPPVGALLVIILSKFRAILALSHHFSPMGELHISLDQEIQDYNIHISWLHLASLGFLLLL